jgi:hypothetical protein
MKTNTICLLLLLSFAHVLSAAPITLFQSGVDSAGVPLPGGASDPHWQIVSGPGISSPAPAVVLTNQQPATSPGYVQTLDSRWIWVSASGIGGTGAPYTFRLTFDLTGLDPATASVTGQWAVDNIGFISLNGQSTGIGSGVLSLPDVIAANYENLHSFTLNSGFLPTINTLDFVVTDDHNPGGLQISGLTGTADVPEPSSWLLLTVGAILMPLRRRRKRKSSNLQQKAMA